MAEVGGGEKNKAKLSGQPRTAPGRGPRRGRDEGLGTPGSARPTRDEGAWASQGTSRRRQKDPSQAVLRMSRK